LLNKNYDYYEYYKKINELDRRFPFIFHTPCSLNCRESRNLNNLYKRTIQKHAPRFYKEFSRKKILRTDFIVSSENNIKKGINGPDLWTDKAGHSYNLVAKKPYNRHYYIYPYLTKDEGYARGTLLSGSVTMQYNHADVKINKFKKIIPNLIHVRKFKLLGRKY
jgi:hypothetical protein